MKGLAVVIGAVILGACSGDLQRIGSEIPPGTLLTGGRVIESATECGFMFAPGYDVVYAELVAAAHGDLITDVEVNDLSARCVSMRARAVKIAQPVAASVPAVPLAAAPLLGAGSQARLRPDAFLRARPLPDAGPVAGANVVSIVVLKAAMKKDTGTWWYVISAAGAGWILETGLEPVTP